MFKRKRFFLFLVLFSISNCFIHAYSQSGFVYRYSTLNDEYPNDIIETNDGGFIVSISVGTYPIDYQTLLIRLNKNGDTIKTFKIGVPQGTCVINDLIKLDNGTFMGLGLKKPGSNPARLWLLTLSDSLTVVHDTTFSTIFYTCWNLLGFINHLHDIIIYGDAIPYNDPGGPTHPFIFKISQINDSLFSHYYTNPWGQIVYAMMEKQDTSGYLMSLEGSMNGSAANSPSQFITFDSDFSITKIDSLPGKLDAYQNTRKLNDSDIILTGLRNFENSSPRTDKIGILKLDTSFHIKKEIFLGPDDTVTYPAYNTNLDLLNLQNIFLGGVVNQDWGGIFSYNKSYIILGKIDSSLNLKWQKYFGGDTYYMVWSIIATTDGGCIIGASTNDFAIMGTQRDVYILKVDSNGLITGIHQPPTNTANNILVYPNPGFDILYVKTQLGNAIFQLYDLMGREVCNKDLIPGQNVLQVQNLNAGIYVYKVVKNSQMIECGKWIKE